MYIQNDVVYAGEAIDDMKIQAVKPLPYGMLLLTFSTGEKRLFDTTLLQGTAFAPLSDKEVFNGVQVTHGYVTWNNGEIDCAPEYMYKHSYAYEEDFIA